MGCWQQRSAAMLPSKACALTIIQKERFLEIAPRCIGVHSHGDELVLPEMDYISKGELFTAIPRTGFFGSTASLTEAQTPSCWRGKP